MSAINEKAVNGTQLQRTHKKIYRHLMPLLIVAYIISFIDRTNIGMAKATMSVDIGLSATAFGLGAGLFFLTYAVLEIPSNLFLTRIGARRWIARIMITWGILSCGMAFVTGPTSFYVMRLLLGAAEAGLYPGIIYYLTLWFGREERAKATGLFLLGVCLANIIGAPLGGLLLSLDGMSGWHGWQWMFFIEGLPAIALAFVVWRRLPDKPADARWLDSDDVQAINAVLAKEAEETRHTPSRFSLKTALSTRVFLLLVLIYFTHQFSVYGLSYFLPGIIGSWGQLTPLQVGLLTAIPWIAAAAGGILLTQIVYMGINVVLPPYLYHVSGLSLAASAGLSIIFTLTGTLGQIIWPWLSDSFGRKRTLIVCGLWMSIGIALFYFATNMPRLIAIQLFFGLVANAVWPIYYAMASDSAEERATSTANGIITTAMFIGGGISPLLMGWLIQFGGGWENPAGYIYAFFTMAGCALLGMLLQLMTTDKTPRKAH
ncbi:MFS transporter [Klebsiella pneumoniae]